MTISSHPEAPWLRLPPGRIHELVREPGEAGTVPVRLRWRWEDREMQGRTVTLLVDPLGRAWEWKLQAGFLLRRLK